MTLIKTAFTGSIINLLFSILLIIFLLVFLFKNKLPNSVTSRLNKFNAENLISKNKIYLLIGILILILCIESVFIHFTRKHQDNDMKTSALKEINAYQWTIFSLFIILILGLICWFYFLKRKTLANLTGPSL